MNLFSSFIVNFIILSDWIWNLVNLVKVIQNVQSWNSVHFTYLLTSASVDVLNTVVWVYLHILVTAWISLCKFSFKKKKKKKGKRNLEYVPLFISSGDVKLIISNWAGLLLVYISNSYYGRYNALLSLQFTCAMNSAFGLVLQASGCIWLDRALARF